VKIYIITGMQIP